MNKQCLELDVPLAEVLGAGGRVLPTPQMASCSHLCMPNCRPKSFFLLLAHVSIPVALVPAPRSSELCACPYCLVDKAGLFKLLCCLFERCKSILLHTPTPQ